MKAYEAHGHTRARQRSRTYLSWRNMISRCTNRARPDYKHYGARGIVVCDRWLMSFAAFLEDMGECPPGRSLDRRNNENGYHPDNCRWASKDEQMQNTRATQLLTHDGVTLGVAAWARRLGISRETIQQRRRKGWPLQMVLATTDYRERA